MEIIAIKLGAKGDVVRTLPILKAIKEKYPSARLTLVTNPNILDLLNGQKFIDVLQPIPFESGEKYDLLFNFDIEDEATSLAQKINANEKRGFYAEGGFMQAYNIGAEFYLNTLFDDELKQSNRKTYQEMMYAAAEMPQKRENVLLVLNAEDETYVQKFFQENNLNEKKTIGIHMGASPRWPSKIWHEEEVKRFIKKANAKGYNILLFGGPQELESHKKLSEELQKENVKFVSNNPSNSDREFASLVEKCKVMVCSDSFALHVALALNVKTLGLFFCTSPWEVEGYGLLTKCIAPRLEEFFPQKMDQYDEELTRSISHEKVFAAAEEVIHTKL